MKWRYFECRDLRDCLVLEISEKRKASSIRLSLEFFGAYVWVVKLVRVVRKNDVCLVQGRILENGWV